MENKLNKHLDNGEYFLSQRLREVREILEYFSKSKLSDGELKKFAKSGLSWLNPCIKWADELREKRKGE